MNNFLLDTIRRSEIELRLAIADHAATYPDGDWKAANDRIGCARLIADAALRACRHWPAGERFLGNDAVLALLREAGLPTPKSE